MTTIIPFSQTTVPDPMRPLLLHLYDFVLGFPFSLIGMYDVCTGNMIFKHLFTYMKDWVEFNDTIIILVRVCQIDVQGVRNCVLFTLLIAEILSGKNVRAWVSMDFTQDKFSAPIAIEKIKILGAPWELLAKQHCQSSPFTSNLGQIGQIGSAV